jgi:hypothetical protein
MREQAQRGDEQMNHIVNMTTVFQGMAYLTRAGTGTSGGNRIGEQPMEHCNIPRGKMADDVRPWCLLAIPPVTLVANAITESIGTLAKKGLLSPGYLIDRNSCARIVGMRST